MPTQEPAKDKGTETSKSNGSSFREVKPLGPATPEPPYPICCSTVIIPGFGRGSSDLGIPTANVPQDIIDNELRCLEPGVYYGWASVAEDKTQSQDNGVRMVDRIDGKTQVELNYGTKLESSESNTVYPMVMSVGWNPFYKNDKKTAEIHIMNKFSSSAFYGARINFVVLGYIRPELDYVSVEALVHDINTDIAIAEVSLARPAYEKFKSDKLFQNCSI